MSAVQDTVGTCTSEKVIGSRPTSVKPSRAGQETTVDELLVVSLAVLTIFFFRLGGLTTEQNVLRADDARATVSLNEATMCWRKTKSPFENGGTR
jgi:hypothetical protein